MALNKKMRLAFLKKAGYEVQNPKLALALTFIFALVFSSFAFYFGANAAWQETQKESIYQVRERLLLDIDYVGLEDPLLNMPENSTRKQHYIDTLNEQLAQKGHPISVVEISNIDPRPVEEPLGVEVLTRANTTNVYLTLAFAPINVGTALSLLPLFLALILCALVWPFYKKRVLQRQRDALTPHVEEQKYKLIINLNDKTLSFGESATPVSLANKPLCFYLALIEYSVEFPDNTLNQNKEMPAELVELSHKYFARLVALGHTIRKRPNFNNSIEKTLSEIRAVLDEVFEHYPEEKEPFFPPKAHGEGSRSRVHHYGLGVSNYDSVDVIGK